MSNRLFISLLAASVVRAFALWFFPWPEHQAFVVRASGQNAMVVLCAHLVYELMWFTTPALLVWLLVGDLKKKLRLPW